MSPDHLNTSSDQKGVCPMRKITDASDLIRQYCHNIFGKPSINNKNILGGIDGKIFVDFLVEFLGNIVNMEILQPEKMGKVPVIGSERAQMFTEWILQKLDEKKVSRLAQIIYKKFIQYSLQHIGENDISKQVHLMGFSVTFIQAFDSFFITASRYASSIEEWEKMKDSIWKAVIHLSSIPSNIQEGLTSSHNKANYHFGVEYPYMLDHIGEIFAVQMESPDLAFGPVREIISEKGGYGVCPALVDGTLKKAFEILFKIYGEIIIKPKSSR